MSAWLMAISWAGVLALGMVFSQALTWRRRWEELGRTHARTLDQLVNARAEIEVLRSRLDHPEYWIAAAPAQTPPHDPVGHRPGAAVLRLWPKTAAGLVPPGWARPQDRVSQERQPLPGVQAPVGQCPPGPQAGGGGGESGPWIDPPPVVEAVWDLRPVPQTDDLGGVPRGSLDPHR